MYLNIIPSSPIYSKQAFPKRFSYKILYATSFSSFLDRYTVLMGKTNRKSDLARKWTPDYYYYYYYYWIPNELPLFWIFNWRRRQNWFPKRCTFRTICLTQTMDDVKLACHNTIKCDSDMYNLTMHRKMRSELKTFVMKPQTEAPLGTKIRTFFQTRFTQM